MAKPELDDPFLILVMGDFSGRASRGIKQPLTGRKPYPVDCDTIDAAIKQFRPKVRIPVDTSGLEIEFENLDSFHPDQLFENLQIFEDLRDAMRSQPPKPAPVRRPVPQPEFTSGSLLDQIVSGTDPLQTFIDRTVAPHTIAKESASDKEWKSRVQTMASDALAALLHHRSFQKLEAAWRGLDFLVRTLETGPQLKVYVLDVSLDELRQSAQELQQLLAAGMKWSLLLADFVLAPTIPDIELMARLALLAATAEAPLIAQASDFVLGCRSIAATPYQEDWNLDQPVWEELRTFPESNWLGLAMPSFMGRMPYGRSGATTECFPFEELGSEPAHADYLWCNAAFAVGALIGRSFSEAAWKMRLGEFRTLDHMPMHVRGEELVPGAEVLLTQRAVEAMIEHGVMPLIARKDGDSLLLGMFQSVNRANPALPGRWRL
jgi:type VI secretion system ImpC/EvpB family protein